MVLNLNYIDSIAGDNLEVKNKLIKILHQELNDNLIEFNKNLELSNFNEIAKILHKTNHKIKMFDLITFFDFTQELEKKCSNNTLNKHEVDYFQQTLKNIIDKLQQHDELYNN